MDDSNLIQRYLSSKSEFWSNVQEPSTRVSDKALLSKLAAYAFDLFDDLHIKSAAAVVLLYRAADSDWSGDIDEDTLLSWANECRSQLKPKESFFACRWFLSLGLAESALHASHKRYGLACEVLKQSEDLLEYAYSNGQLFTNVVKSSLLRVALSLLISPERALRLSWLCSALLEKSGAAALNYRFENQYAYEEVAYVYTMLRQIYNFARISGECDEDTLSLKWLEGRGFNWRVVGEPFNRLV